VGILLFFLYSFHENTKSKDSALLRTSKSIIENIGGKLEQVSQVEKYNPLHLPLTEAAN